MAAKAQTNDYVQDVVSFNSSGWIDEAEEHVWSYVSADSPTFIVLVNADMTAVLSAGMRVRLTQTTVKYFLVTAVGSYSAGATQITLYGGTDYTLTSDDIYSVSYSSQKAPFGFPLDPGKWTVTVTDTTRRTQSSPTVNTWYNLGSLSINIPIGLWNVYYKINPSTNDTYLAGIVQVSLSTSPSSETNTDFTTEFYLGTGSLIGVAMANTLTVQGVLSLSSKTTYYVIAQHQVTTTTALELANDRIYMIVRSVSAYL